MGGLDMAQEDKNVTIPPEMTVSYTHLALVDTGWIDVAADGFYIHDWDTWQEQWYKLQKNRRLDAERKRKMCIRDRGNAVQRIADDFADVVEMRLSCRAYQAVDHGKVFFPAGRPRDGEERKNPHAQHGVISKPNPGLDSVLGLYQVFVQNRVFRGSGCHMAAYG